MQATPTNSDYAGIDWSWQHHALCVVRNGFDVVVISAPAGEVTTRLLRIRGQKGRPVRRRRLDRRAAHRHRPLGGGSTRQPRDDRTADVGPCPARPDRSPDRGPQPAPGRPATQLPRLDRAAHRLDIGISLAFLRRFPTAKASWLTAGMGELRMTHWLKANGYCGRHTPTRLITHPREAATGRVAGAAAEASGVLVLTLVPDHHLANPAGPARVANHGSALRAP